jgi:hypothetical protein
MAAKQFLLPVPVAIPAVRLKGETPAAAQSSGVSGLRGGIVASQQRPFDHQPAAFPFSEHK